MFSHYNYSQGVLIVRCCQCMQALMRVRAEPDINDFLRIWNGNYSTFLANFGLNNNTYINFKN